MTDEEIQRMNMAMELAAIGPSVMKHPSIFHGLQHMLGIKPSDHQEFVEVDHE